MEIAKIQFGPIFYIKSTIISKSSGSKNPGVFVFKNGDETLCIGFGEDINFRIQHSDYENYVQNVRFFRIENKKPIIYTHIEQYLTEDNIIAASLKYILIRELRPKFNSENFVKGWNIKEMYETYQNSKPEEKYEITRDLKHMLDEDTGRQISIEEAWGIEE